MASRAYTQKEWKLLSWWLATFHPNAHIIMNARVGQNPMIPGVLTPSAPLVKASRVLNRWVDAIFVEDGTVNIVEAKLAPDPGIFSQLIHYARKFRVDPTYAQYENYPLRLIALVYHDDPSVAEEAPMYGVAWVVYQPSLQGFVPPQLSGTAIGSFGPFLPNDWPQRIKNLLGGGSVGLAPGAGGV